MRRNNVLLFCNHFVDVVLIGRYLLCCPRPFFKVKKLHLKESCSSLVSINMKSSGKRSMFIRTARFKFFVSTPYISARSLSMMTHLPRTLTMRDLMDSGVASSILFSNHKYLRKKLFAATIVLLAMSTLSFAHYFRPRHTVPGGRIPLLKQKGNCASTAAVRCGREHSSRTYFSSFSNMRNLNKMISRK